MQIPFKSDQAAQAGFLHTAFLCAGICMLSAACGKAENIPEILEISDGVCSETTRQMLLYLQEGLRDHEIDQTFTVYISASDEAGLWEAYLDNGENVWYEAVEYTYNAEKDWYTIKSWNEFPKTYEPVLTGDDYEALEKADEKREDIIASAVYKTKLSVNTPLPWPIRYTGPSGPSVTVWDNLDFDLLAEEESCPPFFDCMHYLYQDERRETEILIDYPKIYTPRTYGNKSGDDYDVDKMNQAIHNAFFYMHYDDETEHIPAREGNAYIQRSYLITCRNQRYISMRIKEFNSYRWANHPNEWEKGLTLDCTTGEVVALSDIIKGETLITELLETGAFRCVQIWISGNESLEEAERQNLKEIIEDFQRSKETISDLDSSDFYLTENGLGLVTSDGRYYTCLEADLADLTDFLTAQ